jgi:glycosyltransferase involved in cell wall biosynthesis
MTIRHIVTGEYPPAVGGVADYTATVAAALAASGEHVHVWCGGEGDDVSGNIAVHRVMGRFGPAGLAAADRALARFKPPRRLLVQWVPHAYGCASLNLAFCSWVRHRAVKHGDMVEIMVHEPFLPFSGGLRRRGAAVVQRLMARLLMAHASRILVATAAWIPLCRPYAPGVPFSWAPVPSGVAAASPVADSGVLRELPRNGGVVIGSFGQAGAVQRTGMLRTARALTTAGLRGTIVLIGAGSEATRRAIAASDPQLASSIHATGTVSAEHASLWLRACDVLVQPYPDGVCGRHSSAMAALAHGLPVVTTDGRFTEPVWRESNAVRLVAMASSDAPERLGATAVALLRDDAERARLAGAARRLYDACFDVRHTVAALQSEG